MQQVDGGPPDVVKIIENQQQCSLLGEPAQHVSDVLKGTPELRFRGGPSSRW